MPTAVRRRVAPAGAAANGKPKQIHRIGSRRLKRWLIYGDPGAGKSRIAGTAPHALIANCDRPDGLESAREIGSTAEEWFVNSWAEMDSVMEYVRHLKPYPEGPYEWFGIDSVTLLQESGMDQIMEELVRGKPHRSLWIPDQLQYVENMNRLKKLVRQLKSVNVNVLLTAHVLREEDEDDGTVSYMPAIQGKQMPSKVCAYMGVVGRLYVASKDGKEVRVLQTARDAKWYAKGPGLLGKRVVDPTIPRLIEKFGESSSGPARRIRRVSKEV